MLRLGALFRIGLALFGCWVAAPAAAEDAAPVNVTGPVTAAQMELVFAPPAGARPVPRPLEPFPAAGLAANGLAPVRSPRPRLRDTWDVPRLRWDGHPRGPRWTAAVMAALRGPGAPLLDVVPRDIAQWCPGYPMADDAQRAAFWAGLVSTLAWHESTHDPRAVGGGGRWFGLVQIAPGTARWRNCAVGTGEALLDGPANLRCGIRIMAITVPRDGVVSEGMRGVAADWGPFHSTRKREDMRNWVRSQDYCLPRTRPMLRPDRSDAAPVAAPRLPEARPEQAVAQAVAR